MSIATGPHKNAHVELRGTPLAQAQAAMLLLHGRGATAEDILTLTDELQAPGMAFLAPQASGYTWYPNSFLAPIPSNEPWLTSALSVIADTLATIQAANIPLEKVLLLGFSQGACLATEYVARNAQRYGGVAGLSGGLIGPEGTPRDYSGSLEGTPIFLGCSDRDFHIPKERVIQSDQVFKRMGAEITTRLYPNMGHSVNQDEIDALQRLVTAALK